MRNVLAILLISVLSGQSISQGGYAGAFTMLGTDARSVALGGATIADINNGYLAFTNPASVSYVDKLEFGLTHITMPLDRSLQSASFAAHLPPTAGVSLSYLRAGDDNIQGRNSVGQKTEMLGYSEQLISLAFANQLTQTLSMGMNAKLFIIYLADENTKGFGVDFGVLYHRPSGLNAALQVKNLTGSYSWKISGSSGDNVYDDYFPLIINAGVRLPWRTFALYGAVNHTYARVSVDNSAAYADPFTTIHLAMEAEIESRIYVRAGMNNTTPTVGAGLLYSIRSHKDSRVDYTFHPGSAREGFGHLFSWIFSL